MAVEIRTFPRIFPRALLCVVLGCLLLSAAAPSAPASSGQPPQASDALFCTDGMETEPFNDVYEAVPVAVREGGCQVSQAPIAA